MTGVSTARRRQGQASCKFNTLVEHKDLGKAVIANCGTFLSMKVGLKNPIRVVDAACNSA